MAEIDKCYKVAWNDNLKSYVIKTMKISDLNEFDENVFFNLEYAEMRLKELQTGKIPHKTSPKEFEEKMLESKRAYYEKYHSPEEGHGDMDNIMCDLLIELGYGKGVKVFKSVEKWYA